MDELVHVARMANESYKAFKQIVIGLKEIDERFKKVEETCLVCTWKDNQINLYNPN